MTRFDTWQGNPRLLLKPCCNFVPHAGQISGKNYPDSICERATARPLAHQGIMPQRPRLTPAADFFASGRVTFIVSV